MPARLSPLRDNDRRARLDGFLRIRDALHLTDERNIGGVNLVGNCVPGKRCFLQIRR